MTFTERLAIAAARRPRRTVGIWLAAFVGAIVCIALLIPTALSSDRILYGTESKEGQDLIDDRLAEPDNPEIVVVRSESLKVDDPAFRGRVEALTNRIRAVGGTRPVNAYDDPERALVSADRNATTISVRLLGDETEQEEGVEKVVDVVEAVDGQGGLDVTIAGELTGDLDRQTLSERDLQKGELLFGLPMAMVVLVLVFGALVAALTPLAVAIFSIVVALALITVIGQAWQPSIFVVNMLTAMGLALGIDYSLFIVSRYREERARGRDKLDAIATAGATSSRAVFFSGLVFVLALLGMLMVPDSILRSLGLGAIVVGAVSVVAALTLIPALLSLLGDRVNSLRVPLLGRSIDAAAAGEGRFWARVARVVMRRPVASLVAAAALLIVASVPVLDLEIRETGVVDFPNDLPSKQGFVALNEEFPGVTAQPVDIVVEGDVRSPETGAAIERLQASLRQHDLFGRPTLETNRAGDLALVSASIGGDPESGRATDAVQGLREETVPAAFAGVEAKVIVTGTSAETLDTKKITDTWLPIVIGFVLALSFVLLTLAFRSLVVPLKAIILNLLSVGAAYGLMTLVFQKGVATDLLGFEKVESVTSWVPLFLFSVLFGLSMDYHVFLLSRIRERFDRTGDNAEAVASGLSSTARLITGAALIMVVVFTGFALGDLPMFQQMGFGLAVALLIDATIVRSVLLPASMKLLGDRNWYLPSWLEWLPRIGAEPAVQPPPRPAA
jgi:uncharacterized membrane protein YdfJ with MMPL/SSD domain